MLTIPSFPFIGLTIAWSEPKILHFLIYKKPFTAGKLVIAPLVRPKVETIPSALASYGNIAA
ncbi:MAG TPA: hypothetical protein VNH18_36750 [Bryobacteraceae bacterium]|jgi:hypothetical protein|nr:hypothetical protein [Bryobacteraceae bacterium]